MADSPDISLATTLPLGLKLLFLGTLCVAALGLVWAVVVCCVVQRSEAVRSKTTYSDEEAWRSDTTQTQHSSKDTKDVSNSFADPQTTHEPSDKPAALSSCIAVPPTPRYRGRGNAVLASPRNPFLDPPSEAEDVRVERTEGEWTRARAVFFAEMEAAEVEMGVLSRGRVVDVGAPAREKRSGRSGVVAVARRGVEMVDEGVEMVDGVVEGVVDVVARWTEGEG